MDLSLKHEVETKIFDLSILIEEYLQNTLTKKNGEDISVSTISNAETLKKYSNDELSTTINNHIVEIDTLISQVLLPKELNQVYINAKLKYFEKYSDSRIYESTRKSNKLDMIYDDANEIAEITKYIKQKVEDDEEVIDCLVIKMADQEEEVANAHDELQTANTRAISKIRFYRTLYVGFGLFGLYFTYKLIK